MRNSFQRDVTKTLEEMDILITEILRYFISQNQIKAIRLLYNVAFLQDSIDRNKQLIDTNIFY